jgi:hypothetical protein
LGIGLKTHTLFGIAVEHMETLERDYIAIGVLEIAYL